MKKLVTLLMLVSAWVLCTAALAADPELAKKSTIQEILERKSLRVGFDAGYMPFEMTDSKGNYVGFDIDMARALAKSMGVKFEPVNVDFDGMIPALLTGKVDIIISAMTVTQERNLKIGFTDPYIIVGQSILLNKKLEGTITSWEQLNDPKYNVVSRQGTTGEEAVKRHLPKSTFRTFEKEADGALEVANGRADAWVYDMPFNVVFFAEQGKGRMIHLDKPFTYEPVAMGIRQGDPDFMNYLNNFLRQIKADGRYDRMYDKWMKSTDWFSQIQR